MLFFYTHFPPYLSLKSFGFVMTECPFVGELSLQSVGEQHWMGK